jgi:hypothetical protein
MAKDSVCLFEYGDASPAALVDGKGCPGMARFFGEGFGFSPSRVEV